jgi:hypothetical protein
MLWQCSLLQRQHKRCWSPLSGTTRSGHTPRPAGQHCTLRQKVRRRNAVGCMAAGTRAPGQCTAAGSAGMHCAVRGEGSTCACVLYYPAACAQQGVILCAAACLWPTTYADCLSCRVDASSCCTPQNHHSSCSPPHQQRPGQQPGTGVADSTTGYLCTVPCCMSNTRRFAVSSRQINQTPKAGCRCQPPGWVQSATWVRPVSRLGGSSQTPGPCQRQQLAQSDSDMLTEAGEVLSCCVPCTCAVSTAAGA